MTPKTENIVQIKSTFFDWVSRALVGLLTWFAYNIYADVKELGKTVPVLQEQIQTLKSRIERMENKVFTDDRFQYPYNRPQAKHEDEITLDNLTKK